MKTKIFFQIIIAGLINVAFAQDILFENTNQALVDLNPSFAGSNGGLRLQNYYRNQWPNLSGRYVTYQSSVDVYFKKTKGALAVTSLFDDQAKGTLKTSQLGLAYAQHISLMDGKLKVIPSLQVSYIQLHLDVSALRFGDPINTRSVAKWTNPSIIPASRKSNLDFNSGILCQYKQLNMGIAVKHFTQPDIGLAGPSKWPALYRVHASYNKKINDKNLLQFFVMYNNQNNFSYLQLSTNAVLFNHLVTGLTYYSGNDAGINVGFRNSFISLQLTYSANVSKLAGNTAGTWGLSLSLNLRNKELRRELTSFEAW